MTNPSNAVKIGRWLSQHLLHQQKDLRLSQHVHVKDGLRAMTPVYDASTRRGRDIRIPGALAPQV